MKKLHKFERSGPIRLTVRFERGGGLETRRPNRMLLLTSILDVTDGEAHSWQRIAPGQWRPDRMLLLQREPLLGVLVLVDSRDTSLELCDASVMAEVYVMRHRS